MHDIVDGNVDLDQLAKEEEEQEKLDKTMAEIKRREAEERLLKGRPGKGHIKGYKVICKGCFTE